MSHAIPASMNDEGLKVLKIKVLKIKASINEIPASINDEGNLGLG